MKRFNTKWMSANASDTCRIAVQLGNYDPHELFLAIHTQQKGRSSTKYGEYGFAKVNLTTILNALDKIKEAYDHDLHQINAPNTFSS